MTTVKGLDTTRVKEIIGDSTNNNRTLTVRQVIRYLTTRRNKTRKKLGKQLDAVYDYLRDYVVNTRLNNRTDAVDINEFLFALGYTTDFGTTKRKRAISRRVTTA